MSIQLVVLLMTQGSFFPLMGRLRLRTSGQLEKLFKKQVEMFRHTEMLLAGDAGKITKEQKGMLEEIHTGNERMVELVGALLNTSCLDLGTFSVDPELTDISQFTQDVVDQMRPRAEECKVTIEASIDEDIGEVSVDRKLTSMIFENLLSNAVKYAPERDGKAEVTLEKIVARESTGEVDVLEDSLHYQVKDNGMGIPESQKDQIFQKMFRADNVRVANVDGTGLGLYLVKAIVSHVDGQVWFESEEGKGSTFHVLLPMAGMKKREGEKKLG